MRMDLIGLGRMGANMREGLRTGHDVVGFDSARSATCSRVRSSLTDMVSAAPLVPGEHRSSPPRCSPNFHPGSWIHRR